MKKFSAARALQLFLVFLSVVLMVGPSRIIVRGDGGDGDEGGVGDGAQKKNNNHNPPTDPPPRSPPPSTSPSPSPSTSPTPSPSPPSFHNPKVPCHIDGTCYRILGCSRSATLPGIKHCYRQAALLVHPDKPHGSTVAFRKVQGALTVLMDTSHRTRYDRKFPHDGTPPPSTDNNKNNSSSKKNSNNKPNKTGPKRHHDEPMKNGREGTGKGGGGDEETKKKKPSGGKKKQSSNTNRTNRQRTKSAQHQRTRQDHNGRADGSDGTKSKSNSKRNGSAHSNRRKNKNRRSNGSDDPSAPSEFCNRIFNLADTDLCGLLEYLTGENPRRFPFRDPRSVLVAVLGRLYLLYLKGVSVACLYILGLLFLWSLFTWRPNVVRSMYFVRLIIGVAVNATIMTFIIDQLCVLFETTVQDIGDVSEAFVEWRETHTTTCENILDEEFTLEYMRLTVWVTSLLVLTCCYHARSLWAGATPMFWQLSFAFMLWCANDGCKT